MKEIRLTKGQIALVDDCDYDVVMAATSYWKAKRGPHKFYAVGQHKRSGVMKYFSMHRIILDLHDPLIYVDHIDGNGLNNTRSNLRICNASENAMNRPKRSDKEHSKYKGVIFRARCTKTPWGAVICCNKKRIFIGGYFTELDAAIAYDAAAKKYHGAFAFTNFDSPLPR